MLLWDEISIRQYRQNRSFGTFQTPVSHSRVHLLDRGFKNSVCVHTAFFFSTSAIQATFILLAVSEPKPSAIAGYQINPNIIVLHTTLYDLTMFC